MIKLRYGNTNTFYIPGAKGGLLIDTDWAGTLPQFFKAIKSAGLGISDISYVLATHYHPDHVGIIGELQRLGVVLLVADVQHGFLHFPDEIFFKRQAASLCADRRNSGKGPSLRGEPCIPA